MAKLATSSVRVIEANGSGYPAAVQRELEMRS